MALPDDIDIEELFPHRRPMRLVERLEQAQDDGGLVSGRVRSDWPLVVDGRADPLVLIEFVAQGAAVLAGYRRRHLEKMGGRGWLVGIRRTRLSTADIPVGTELRAEIEVDYEVDTYAVFRGRVSAAGQDLAEVEIQTFRPDDAAWQEG